MFCGAAVGEVKNSGTQVPSLLPGVFGVAYCVSLRVAALASGAGSGSSSCLASLQVAVLSRFHFHLLGAVDIFRTVVGGADSLRAGSIPV